MILNVNGKQTDVENLGTAAELLKHLGIPLERVAVVINEAVVRRADLENTALNEGDAVEIITMVGGG